MGWPTTRRSSSTRPPARQRFLHAVVQHIYTTIQEMGMADAWTAYVPEKLLPRVFGFELLMAPYTVAHLKLSMLLQQLGYDFGKDERLRIYLTNALDELPAGQATLPFTSFIVDEGIQARAVKQDKPVMVVLGSPPYSGHSANASWKISKENGRNKKNKPLSVD
ncbi:MAG: hypothetical protein HC876_23575 [Chloroflexaceae bacterium]|nr:hypothetical protein [Chloroflexaceae bacterium]